MKPAENHLEFFRVGLTWIDEDDGMVGIVDTGFGGSSDDANTVSIGTTAPGEDAAVLDVYGSILVNGDSPAPSASPARLHIKGNEVNEPNIYLESTSGLAPQTWRIRTNPNNGRLTFNDVGGNVGIKIAPGAQNNLLRVGIADNGIGGSFHQPNTVTIGSNSAVDGENTTILDVYGSILINGAVIPDYVFHPDFDLLSIEDHAEFMWERSHLPALPKAPEGLVGSVDIATHQMGMLEELETAHIYIDQLNNLVKNQDQQLQDQGRQLKDQNQVLQEQSRLLLEQNRLLESLQQRLVALEAL